MIRYLETEEKEDAWISGERRSRKIPRNFAIIILRKK